MISYLAYRLSLMRRALGRSDEELFGRRALYESKAREIAGRIIAGECDSPAELTQLVIEVASADDASKSPCGQPVARL